MKPSVHETVAEHAAFLEGGVAILAATASVANVPTAVRAWGATVIDGGRAVRILLPNVAQGVWDDLRDTGALAVCFTDVASYRSVQLKGRIRNPDEPVTADDTATWDRYQERFFEAVESGSHVPRALASRLAPAAVRPVVLDIAEAFDQTPGPAAGRSLGAAVR